MITRLLDGGDQRSGVRLTGDMRLLLGDIGVINIVALFQCLFDAFDTVTTGEAIKCQRKSM